MGEVMCLKGVWGVVGSEVDKDTLSQILTTH